MVSLLGAVMSVAYCIIAVVSTVLRLRRSCLDLASLFEWFADEINACVLL
jgi:hypothetical protein